MKIQKVGLIGLGCLAAMGLMACGKSGEAQATKDGEVSGEVRYAFWDTQQQPYLEECIKRFNVEYPSVKISLEPGTWDEYWTKLEAGATGGSIADVFWLNGPNIAKYADGGVLMDIDDRIAQSGIDKTKYPDGLIKLYNVNGKQYAIPKDFDTIGVWYNKKIFDEAGVPYPTDDWTWEEMADIAKKLTKADGSVYGIAAPFNTQKGIYNTIHANGGYVISEDKKTSGYSKEETKEGIQCWVDLQKAGVSPTEASLEESEAEVQFLSGRLAMMWGGSWFLNQVLPSDLKDDIDVAELPSLNGKKGTVIHGLGNCIYKGTKNPEAAWKWVEFLAGEEANRISAEKGAAIPSYEGTADIWANQHQNYNLKAFIKAANEYSYAYPVSKKTAEWEKVQSDTLKKVFSLELDVKEACDTIAEKMDELLANENK